jgi:hypothetical protein
MELIDGATLGEHITSLKEKNEKFLESQIWKIFMQVILYNGLSKAMTETCY